ncbi:MAG: GNAT family N-acetyltransferase [Planctomycetota bacterium]|jgi:predicted GNAT family N-acyltransferase
MTVTYLSSVPDSESYHRLFESTGWNERYAASHPELARALADSWHFVTARDKDRLIGSGRIISDGVLYALVLDIMVDPDYRGQGIGREIMTRLLAEVREACIRDVMLFSAKGYADFYAKFGFEARPDDAPGMILRDL